MLLLNFLVAVFMSIHFLDGTVQAEQSDRNDDVKTTAQAIFSIIRQPNGNIPFDTITSDAAGSTKQAQFEAELQEAKPALNLTEATLREGRHAADAVKIQNVLIRLVNNVAAVEESQARLLGELVGEIAVNARIQLKGQSSPETNPGSSLRTLNIELENVILPLGTALARLLVERKSNLPPPVIHQEMENGISAVIERQQQSNESIHFARMLANQIHLQEFAVCGHLILHGLIQPYDYLEAIGCGVGEVIAIMNDDDRCATLAMVLRTLETQISARIKIALILAGVPHNESVMKALKTDLVHSSTEQYEYEYHQTAPLKVWNGFQLQDGISLLANEIANYTAADIVRLMDRSKELDVARQEMRMASAYYAKALWNMRILNLGSLVVLRTPPSLITFTFEDDLASYIPATWLRFDYVDLRPPLELYNSRNIASDVERTPAT